LLTALRAACEDYTHTPFLAHDLKKAVLQRTVQLTLRIVVDTTIKKTKTIKAQQHLKILTSIL